MFQENKAENRSFSAKSCVISGSFAENKLQIQTSYRALPLYLCVWVCVRMSRCLVAYVCLCFCVEEHTTSSRNLDIRTHLTQHPQTQLQPHTTSSRTTSSVLWRSSAHYFLTHKNLLRARRRHVFLLPLGYWLPMYVCVCVSKNTLLPLTQKLPARKFL